MTEQQMDLSIIIVTYNNEATIVECLQSIYSINCGCNFEVVVVDNGPQGKTADLVDAVFKSKQNLIIKRNEKNGGFGQGNNIGAKNAQGRNLLFLNPDTVLVDNILPRVIEVLETKQNISAVGCHLVSRELKDAASFAVMPEKYSVLSINKIYMFLLKFTDLILRGSYPWGAFMAVRKKDFINAGCFDEKFFLNFEEADLVRRLGSKDVYILKERVVHDEGFSKKSIDTLQHYFLSEEYYFSKYDKKIYSRFKKRILLKLKIKEKIFGFLLNSHEREQLVRYPK